MITAELINAALMDVMCEHTLGGGASRIVYSCRFSERIVIKVAHGENEEHIRNFQNVSEWTTWTKLKDLPAGKWLAPCLGISGDGLVLVQAATTRPTYFPDKVPAFLDDLARCNWGMYEGRIVCHDYGYTKPLTSDRLVKAHWIER